jgi:putative tricarboxylic transport membrane protein
MLTRRDLLRSAAATPVAAALPFLSIDAAQAQGSAQVIDLLKMFVPAAPGGGWDQTARTIEQVLRATGAVKGVQITNVAAPAEPSGCHSFSISGKGRATP